MERGMKGIKSVYTKHKAIIIALAAIVLAALFLNILTVPTSDDLGYSISNGLIDILHREYVQYMTWTGRTVAHLFARFFLTMPKLVFDVANALMFAALITLINLHASQDSRPIQPLGLTVSAALVFLFAPVFGQTVLWETGSCNYLWTTTIILFFLYLYRRAKVNAPVLFLIGIVAGWTNENTGGALLLACLFFIALPYARRRRPPLRQWAGLAGALIGFLFLLLAPGNRIRALDFVDNGGLAYKTTHGLFNTLHVFDQQPGLLVLLVLFVILFALAPRTRQKWTGTAFTICGALAVGAMLLSPVPVLFDRSMFGATIFVVVGIMTLGYCIDGDVVLKTAQRVLGAVLALFCAFAYMAAVFDLGYTRYQWRLRERWVEAMKEEGNRNPVIPEINSEFFTSYNAMKGLHDILSYPTFVNNVNYALTHDLESVTATNPQQWGRIYRTGDPQLMNCRDVESWLAEAREKDALLLVVSSAPEDGEKSVRAALGLSVTDDEYIAAIIDGEDTILAAGTKPGMVEATRYGQYFYVSSAADGGHADILINGQECSNNQKGITVVAFDKVEGRILDAVTWNKDMGRDGIRIYAEQEN